VTRERRRYRVHGEVQGVGFRAFVWREARRLGVEGWARNRYDGSVEVLAEGSPLQLDTLASALADGPRMSRVDRVESRSETGDEPLASGFTILGDA
jgi:acylphosphatase